MRLRITVRRHELPEVRHLFNTAVAHGPGKQRIETVAELLNAINTIVPLESSNGEWGLEDYIIEVTDYECLHYQELKAVLREDDEVVVRALTSNEIRERRNGGRLQITSDGRHLIDGVCWGRRFKPGFPRPEVYIPHRKKRRLLTDESDDTQVALHALPEAPVAVSEAIAFIDNKEYNNEDASDDDEEDDEEYKDNEEEGEDDESTEGASEDASDDEDVDEDELQVPVPDKAARISSRTEELQDLRRTMEYPYSVIQGEDDVVQNEERDALRQQKQHQKLKRKRCQDSTNGEFAEPESSFAGFSSPAKHSQPAVVYPLAGTIVEEHEIIHLGNHAVNQKNSPSHDDTLASESESSENEADDIEKNGTLEQLQYRAFEQRLSELKHDHASSSSSGNGSSEEKAEEVGVDGTAQLRNHPIKQKPSVLSGGYTSSSGSDSSDDESDEDDNGADTSSKVGQEHEKEAEPEDTSSSGSDIDSDSDSDSESSSDNDSSSEESSESGGSSSSSSSDNSVSSVGSRGKFISGEGLKKTSEANGDFAGVQSQMKDTALYQPEQLTDFPRQVGKVNAPPGQGQQKTKRNNERKRLNKIMKRLKEEGKIPGTAKFEELRAYLRDHETDAKDIGPLRKNQEQIIIESHEMKVRKEAIFQRLNAAAPAEPEQAPQPQSEVPIAPASTPAEPEPLNVSVTEEPVVSQLIVEAQPVQQELATKQQVEEPSPKRARLDMASSRRLLFNALGVRTPKTPAAEQALREKLAQPTRPVHIKEIEQQNETIPASASAPLPTDTSKQRWKKKLIVSAVECVANKKHIETPPFPFKHPWQVKKEKEDARRAGIPYTFLQDDEPAEENETQEMDVDRRPDTVAESIDKNQPSQSVTTSRAMTAGDGCMDDDMPIPENFDDLPELKQVDLGQSAVIAYKELHMNERFEPEESPYRVARVIADENGNLQLQLASRYRNSDIVQYDEETGERIFKKFDMPMSQDDQDEADSGIRELSLDQLIRPKLVHPSEAASVVIGDSQWLPPQPSTIGPTSRESKLRRGFIEDSATSRIMETEGDIDTHRRTEINGIIKEAGFDSALDEQLLLPLAEPEPAPAGIEYAADDLEQDQVQHQADHTQNTANNWRSSIDPASSPFQALGDASGLRESSVASESIVESVRYPNLSQLGLDTPSVNVQSSSHQDAQRLTPTPAVGTSATLKSPDVTEDIVDVSGYDHGDDGPSHGQPDYEYLPSQVPQTQSQHQEQDTASQDGDKHTKAQHEAAGLSLAGLDGYVSPDHDTDLEAPDDIESLDSDGFPSLRALTSNQKSRKAEKKEKVKPEPVRRSPRVSRTRDRDTGVISDTFWSDDDDDTYSQSQKKVKVSASQRETRATRLSQIPEDTAVVDLTQPSPVSSPAKPARGTGRTGAGVKASNMGGGQGPAFRRSFEGLGEKSFLKRKKSSL